MQYVTSVSRLALAAGMVIGTALVFPNGVVAQAKALSTREQNSVVAEDLM